MHRSRAGLVYWFGKNPVADPGVLGVFRRSCGVVCAWLLGASSPLGAAVAEFRNGDFSAGLEGWETEGEVQVTSGFALQLDSAAAIARLYQSVEIDRGFWEISFNFQHAFSSQSTVGVLVDTGFATLFLSEDPFQAPANLGELPVDPPAGQQALELFDADFRGLREVGGTVELLGSRPGWSRFTATFRSDGGYLTPFLELVDQNFIDGDSAAAYDDFLLVRIPEPSAGFLLLGWAAAWCWIRRRRPRRG